MWCSTVGVLVALSILVMPRAIEAQPAAKVHRIGRLSPGLSEAGGSQATLEAFRQGLRDLGYVEGQNLLIEYRYAEEKPERLPALAAELVQLQVAVIVAVASVATQAAQQVTRTVPIVMTNSSDPVRLGLVVSLAQPGGNITGLSSQNADLSGKQLELLRQIVPHLARIAVLANRADPGSLQPLHEMQVAAQAMGVQLQVPEVRERADVPKAFATIQQEGAGALVVLLEPSVLTRPRDIAAFALQSRLPTMSNWRSGVAAGGLMSYGVSVLDLHRRAATYVDKILKGATPADLPVEQPTKFELVLNLKTAQALGITIPPHLLVLADEVIK